MKLINVWLTTLSLVLFVACGSDTSATSASVDIEATVVARVQEEISKIPSPTPITKEVIKEVVKEVIKEVEVVKEIPVIVTATPAPITPASRITTPAPKAAPAAPKAKATPAPAPKAKATPAPAPKAAAPAAPKAKKEYRAPTPTPMPTFDASMYQVSYKEVPEEIANGLLYYAGIRASRCFDLVIEPSDNVKYFTEVEFKFKRLDKDGYPVKVGNYLNSLGLFDYGKFLVAPSEIVNARHCWRHTEGLEEYSAEIIGVSIAQGIHLLGEATPIFEAPTEFELSTIIEKIHWSRTPSEDNTGNYPDSCADVEQLSRALGKAEFKDLEIVKESRVRLPDFHEMTGCISDGKIDIFLNNTSEEPRTVWVRIFPYYSGEANISRGQHTAVNRQITVGSNSKYIMEIEHWNMDTVYYPYTYDIELDIRVTK